MQSQVRRGAGRIKYGMRSLYRILSEYGNTRYTWQVMVSGYYVVCTYTVQCVLHERLLFRERMNVHDAPHRRLGDPTRVR